MWWLVVGGVLAIVGAAVALRATSRARRGAKGAPVGVVVALGVSLVFWGLVAAAVGLFVVGR